VRLLRLQPREVLEVGRIDNDTSTPPEPRGRRHDDGIDDRNCTTWPWLPSGERDAGGLNGPEVELFDRHRRQDGLTSVRHAHERPSPMSLRPRVEEWVQIRYGRKTIVRSEAAPEPEPASQSRQPLQNAADSRAWRFDHEALDVSDSVSNCWFSRSASWRCSSSWREASKVHELGLGLGLGPVNERSG
jgi:hypothetical protein